MSPAHLSRGSLLPVPERTEGGRVSVERDDGQVPEGGRAVEHVSQEPRVAGGATEHPVTQTLVDRRQGQDGRGEQEVTQGEVTWQGSKVT